MLQESFLVEKRNVLNEMRMTSMTLQEVRFLSIYLSKINARDASTRMVTFALDDFRKIMGFGRMNQSQIGKTFESLLQKLVSIPLDTGGFAKFQLFKRFELTKNERGSWIVSVDAHDDALPLMFDFKEKYFTYELWNALSLSSTNQIRMYEILKQYEKVGERVISIEELKQMLGLKKTEYPVWADFKKRVLDTCQESLSAKTDLTYEYVPIRTGRKFTDIIFTILKNENYVDRLCLKEFLEPEVLSSYQEEEESEYPDSYILYSEAMGDEFSYEEIDVIFNYISTKEMPYDTGNIDLDRYHFLRTRYAEMNLRGKSTTIQNRFLYFIKMIKNTNL